MTSLYTALASLPIPSYSHPLSSSPSGTTKLNPYNPLPASSQLFTDPTFLGSLPPPSSGIIHVIGAESISLPTNGKQRVVLISRSAQEAYDHTLLALKLYSDSIPVYHFLPQLEGEVVTVDADEWLSTQASPNPQSTSNGQEETPEESLLRSFDSFSLSLLKLTRRPQTPFSHKVSASSKLVINFYPSSLQSSITSFNNVIDISLASPLAKSKIRTLAEGKEVVVVEGGNGKYGPAWASIADVLDGVDLPSPIRSVLLASNVTPEDIVEALHTSAPITHLGDTPSAPIIPSSSISIPGPESTYTNLLTSSRSPLEILNDPSQLAASESTSPLYAFGKAVAIRRERDRLVSLVKDVLKAPNTDPALHKVLGEWLLVRDEPASAKAGKAVEDVLLHPATKDEIELLELGKKGHWEKKNLWIVISNSWSHDLASSGLHHTLASGLDINLLVYETAPSPFSPSAPKQLPKDRKKDLALYALNMGDVYVASVAVYADYAGVINAMREAEAYQGPGLVLAYLPWGEKEDGVNVGGETTGPLERLRETKRAVSGAWWPLFRFNPSSPDNQRFTLDSPAIRAALSEFLDRESHLSQLTLATPSIDKSITSSAGTDLVAARKEKARKAFDALLNSLDGPALQVFYASDGGGAEKVAKKLVGRAKMRGVGATLRMLDEIAGDIAGGLTLEKNFVIVLSVAGQGEYPLNGRSFYKGLSSVKSEPKFADTKFTVFGMGDSHYWPRPEDAGYYNKPARDLFPTLVSLGFSELQPLGLGDDSDPDGFLTGYKPWESSLWRSLGVDTIEVVEEKEEVVANEHIKIASDYLRGTILEGLADKSTGAIGPSDAQLTKFHGTYLQDDRDVRESLTAQGLEPAYSFMIRVRLPGGVCTPAQWLAMDRISDEHGNSTFKLTTRQTFQFHGVVKGHLKPAMQAINKSLLDTIAACGDVNRNVLCTVNPAISDIHTTVYNFSKALSEHLLPRTSAYHEIWLDGKRVAGGEVTDVEPMYGPTYLPRKFKMAVAVPPDNAVDIFTNDVGFIAIVEEGKVVGYNVTVGGGMGVTHANKKTYPRLADVIGFVKPEDGCKAAESIMLVQRDNGNRQDRKNARLKYTIDRMTLPVFKSEVEKRLGKPFLPVRPFNFTSNVDHYGWTQGHDSKHHFTMFIENGRVEDNSRHQFKSGLREVAAAHKGEFRLTANQHLILSNVASEDLEEMKRILAKWGLDNLDHSALRLSSSACVAFPTCGLAMAESERYLPLLVDKLEQVMEELGLRSDSIVMRMTGCPNGCARPWNPEIGFVGKAPGSYLMVLGGSHTGARLAKPYKEAVSEPEIIAICRDLFKRWSVEREHGEAFGDYVIRAGIVKATTHGTNFYDGSVLA